MGHSLATNNKHHYDPYSTVHYSPSQSISRCTPVWRSATLPPCEDSFPDQVCTNQPLQKCQDVPRQECQAIHKKVPVRVSRQVPKKVCDGHSVIDNAVPAHNL